MPGPPEASPQEALGLPASGPRLLLGRRLGTRIPSCRPCTPSCPTSRRGSATTHHSSGSSPGSSGPPPPSGQSHARCGSHPLPHLCSPCQPAPPPRLVGARPHGRQPGDGRYHPLAAAAGGRSPGPRRGPAASLGDHYVPAGPQAGARPHPGGWDWITSHDLRFFHPQRSAADPKACGRHRGRPAHAQRCSLGNGRGAFRCMLRRAVPAAPADFHEPQPVVPASLPHRRDAMPACRSP